MIADGDEGTDKAPRVVARRPAIRPRPVTPPRSAQATAPGTTMTAQPTPTWRLPPVRIPSPRIRVSEAREAERPVLLLVADASDQFELALLHESAETRPVRGTRTIAIALAIAAAGVAILVGAVALSLAFVRPSPSFRATTPARAAGAGTGTKTGAAAAPATATTTATAESVAAAPVIPVFDVKSLPTAR